MIKFLIKCMLIYKKAKKGDIGSRDTIAMLFFGSGEYKEAFKWYKDLAEDNHHDSKYQLGYMYREGLGVKQDLAKAEKWTKEHIQER